MYRKLRELIKRGVYGYYLYRIRRREPPKYIFILSHIRSGSSLLTHILNTNYEISGYGETHLEDTSRDSIDTLAAHLSWHFRRIPVRYFMDKINHNHIIKMDLLLSDDIYSIFLLRRPELSIPSMVKLLGWREDNAEKHYLSRLSKLERYAEIINSKKRSIFFTYEQLIYQTASVFNSLERFLTLRQPLTEQYKILRTTGILSLGDNSEKMKKGYIVRNRKNMEAQLLEKPFDDAAKVYNRCKNTLIKYCTVIETK